MARCGARHPDVMRDRCKLVSGHTDPHLFVTDRPLLQKILFVTTEERDEFLDEYYPDREATDVPGFYSLPDGRGLGVFCESLTIYERQA